MKEKNPKYENLSYKRLDSAGEVQPISVEFRERCREFRKNQTDAEIVLWEHLRNRRLGGYKFLRQHPIAGCIVDFYCWKCKLAIEVDGGIHKEASVKQHDDLRDEFLKQNGVTILRFTNEIVFANTKSVLEQILSVLDGMK